MTRRTWTLLLGIAALGVAAAVLSWPEPEAPAGRATGVAGIAMPELSPTAAMGQRAFETRCSACHGTAGGGVEGAGPPLIHKIYEPSHHGDASFYMAAEAGVRAHHWRFGNMPPIEGVTRAEVATIIAFVREVQRANGIR